MREIKMFVGAKVLHKFSGANVANYTLKKYKGLASKIFTYKSDLVGQTKSYLLSLHSMLKKDLKKLEVFLAVWILKEG